ncbi:MAG: hypothetical protein COA43_10060 [Robiginitomaculum sp.]|nr:MAG: hypothetical protein COA43_10060 [Robiginitomaculum sp.]
MNDLIIPSSLSQALKAGKIILFLGAGASMEAVSACGGKHPPSGGQLTKILSEKFLGRVIPDMSLMSMADLCTSKSSYTAVAETIRDELKKYKISDAHKLIPSFKWHTIATTNYDTFIEDAYGEHPSPLQNVLPFVKDNQPIESRISSTPNPLVLLKLHGCVDHAYDKEVPLILDPSHYETYANGRRRLFSRLEDFAHEMPLLFIGYQLGDPHILSIVRRLEKDGSRPECFVVAPNVDEDVKSHWASKRITCIDARFGEFIKKLDSTIPAAARNLHGLIPKDSLPLTKHFRVNTPPSDELFKSLETDLKHIHALMVVPEQTPKNFYRGFDVDFGGIAASLDVDRRVSSDIILTLIDRIGVNGVELNLLLGAAGSGKSTVLKRVGWDISRDFDTPVFWLNDGGFLHFKTIKEIFNLTGKRIYLLVDNATNCVEEITSILDKALEFSVNITILAADRTSAWNTTGDEIENKYRGDVFTLGQLNTKEIDGLLAKLGKYSALGVLSAFSPEEQKQAFLDADRHLLVALHEVTQGKPFEEILMDEYQSLTPFKAQQLYLDICTLHQFNAKVRAGLISRVSGIPFSLYQEEFFKPLEDVVLVQTNKYTGEHEYMARHKRVASLVFKQVFSEDGDRVKQLVRLIESLDEGYESDRRALNALIKGKNIVDLIGNVDAGREVYDCILNLLGQRWYIFHQRATFELKHRYGSLDLAEASALQALEIEPNRSAVQHTLAEISRRKASLAKTKTQKEFYRNQARKRLSKIKSTRSGHAESSMCKIMLDELKDLAAETDLNNENSVSELVEKSKMVRQKIDKAINNYPLEVDFQKLRSNFFMILKESAKAKQALEKAWALSKNGSGVSMQLARVYLNENDVTKAEEILIESLQEVPDDSMLNLEMARLIIEHKLDIDKAGLYLSRSYRSSDKNYQARYLHAQYLILFSEPESAAELFTQIDEFAPRGYLSKYQSEQTPLAKRLGTIDGRVITKQASFAFVSTPKYPENIFVSSALYSTSEWDKVKINSKMSFTIGFTRQGPVAHTAIEK